MTDYNASTPTAPPSDSSRSNTLSGMDGRTKVAIPRLTQRQQERTEPEKHKRVQKACTNCRARKVRCSGENPRCKNCENLDAECVYPQGRKDRLQSVRDQNIQLVSLLKDLSVRVDDSDKQRIETVLDTVDENPSPVAQAGPSRSLGKRSRRDSPSGPDDEDVDYTPGGEANVAGSVGSNEELDFLDEDLLRTRESRSTGFVGQSSEVQWIRSLQHPMGTLGDGKRKQPNEAQWGPPGGSEEAIVKRAEALHSRRSSFKTGDIPHVTSATFYLDAEIMDVDDVIDPYAMPDSNTANRLFQFYLEKVHRSFPILPRATVQNMRRHLDYLQERRIFSYDAKLQANMNLVFAIAAVYARLTQTELEGDNCEHLMYMMRGVRVLDIKDLAGISTANMSLIQTTGLLSLYYLAVGHVSRAWIMIGLSIRFAMSLGLHLRNEDLKATPAYKEELARIWWSLHAIECVLSAATGRPWVVGKENCTVQAPRHLPEERASDSVAWSAMSSSNVISSLGGFNSDPADLPDAVSFFRARVKIGLITESVLVTIYSPASASMSWEEIENSVASLTKQIEDWASESAPGGFGITVFEFDTRHNTRPDNDFRREQLLLGIYYNSTRILLARPCLCRIEERISGQSKHSVELTQKTARECVQAAKRMTWMLLDRPDPAWLYANGPWWSIIHYIMQAIAVFLLEMAHGCPNSQNDNDEVAKCLKKLIRWLRALRNNNHVADKAFKIVSEIINTHQNRFQSSIHNLMADSDEDGYGGQTSGYPPVPPFNSYYNSINPSSNAYFSPPVWQGDMADMDLDEPGGGFDVPTVDPTQYSLPNDMFGNPFQTDHDMQNVFVGDQGQLWINPLHHHLQQQEEERQEQE